MEKEEGEVSCGPAPSLTGNLREALGPNAHCGVSGSPEVTLELIRDAESGAPPLPAGIAG